MFKKDDKVMCINDGSPYLDGNIQNGKIYTVNSVNGNLLFLYEEKSVYYDWRFRLVEQDKFQISIDGNIDNTIQFNSKEEAIVFLNSEDLDNDHDIIVYKFVAQLESKVIWHEETN